MVLSSSFSIFAPSALETTVALLVDCSAIVAVSSAHFLFSIKPDTIFHIAHHSRVHALKQVLNHTVSNLVIGLQLRINLTADSKTVCLTVRSTEATQTISTAHTLLTKVSRTFFALFKQFFAFIVGHFDTF